MNKPMPYNELDVWKKTKELVLFIYTLTKKYPTEEIYCLVNQLRRCSISILSNIAEGYGRESIKEMVQFLFIARGSLFELEAQISISYDLKYITNDEFEKCMQIILVCKKLLNGFINYYKTQKTLNTNY